MADCGPRNCNWFTGDLCEAGQNVITPFGKTVSWWGLVVNFSGLGVDERCENLPTGGDNCAQV